MKKIKIIHIHTDYKFIWPSLMAFEGNYFDNTVVIIEKKSPYDGPLKKNTFIFDSANKNIRNIINVCNKADLVILYDLDFIKSRIATELPRNIKIAWRFFGYELYSKRKDLFVSEKSFSASMANRHFSIGQFVNIIKPIYHRIKFGGTPLSLFNAAINRINYFLALSLEEYVFLSIYWDNLPEFIKLPHRKVDIDIETLVLNFKNKKYNRDVIIGNNRSLYNNHLDVIETIDRSSNKAKYNFELLFNYGPNNIYTEAVRKTVKNKKYYTIIEEFIPPEKFKQFYEKISALVINGYRQMAGANIIMAIMNGVKVYLNKKNMHGTFLRNEGFHIFTMEDFERDLENDNLFLDYATAKQNLNQLTRFLKKYTALDFQKLLYCRLTEDYEYK